MGESLRVPLANDNSVWVRVWLMAGLTCALFTALLIPVWLFALVTHYVMIAGLWAIPATVVAAIALIMFVVNLVLYTRSASELSMRSLLLSGASMFVIGIEWLVVWAWTWEGYC